MERNMLGYLLAFCFVAFLTMEGGKANEEIENSFNFGSAMTEFAAKILKEGSKHANKNAVLSPGSISIILFMLQHGARGNTLKQINDCLKMTEEQSKEGVQKQIASFAQERADVMLQCGNRFYIKSGFPLNSEFNKTLSEKFGSYIEELNFGETPSEEVAQQINGWVEGATRGAIKDFISPTLISKSTVFLALNAIYFKGNWLHPFKKEMTSNLKFHLTPEESADVPFMQIEREFHSGEDPEAGIQWVDLPFRDQQFSMMFILPTEKHGLSKVMEKFDGNLLYKLMTTASRHKVTLKIPKFKLEQKSSLIKVLERMGITDIFTSSADLQGILPGVGSVLVSEVLHQANVEIDEVGATAASATGAIGQLTATLDIPKEMNFTVDHPFLFFILDKFNDVPLFAGKVHDPRA